MSGLLCAGVLDDRGEVVVPTRSTDGCSGGTVGSALDCDGCRFLDAYDIELVALWTDWDDWTTRGTECATADVGRDGTFAFDRAAPHAAYAVWYRGGTSEGYVSFYSEPFEVCSDDIDRVFTVEIDTYYRRAAR